MLAGARVATGYRVPVLVERRHSLRSEPAAHATARGGLGGTMRGRERLKFSPVNATTRRIVSFNKDVHLI